MVNGRGQTEWVSVSNHDKGSEEMNPVLIEPKSEQDLKLMQVHDGMYLVQNEQRCSGRIIRTLNLNCGQVAMSFT